jgi:lantibiotic biosynthesis protein
MNNCLIYNSELADKINIKICDIADCLLSTQASNISLMGGKAGISLFWTYYSEYSNSVKLEEILAPLMSEIFQVIKKSNISPTFSSGLSGLGWTLEHLEQNGFLEINSELFIKCFDDSLYPCMLKYIQSGNYDYLHGALGVGMYYLNHSSDAKVQLILSYLIDELETQSKVFSNGIAWESLLYGSDEKVYNLGLSHGIASIIYMLSRFHQVNIHPQKTLNLAYGAVNYLLNHKQDPKQFKYLFPGYIPKNKSLPGKYGRLSWCYNDLGISMALLQAGDIFNNESWKKEAINTLLKTTTITEWEEAGVKDACLCHGTSGIAHIYNRAFRYTGVEKFRLSAIYWFEQSLKMAVYDDGLAGFKTYRQPEYGGISNDYSFLEGIAGIGLALISAVSDIEPAWDRALLLS